MSRVPIDLSLSIVTQICIFNKFPHVKKKAYSNIHSHLIWANQKEIETQFKSWMDEGIISVVTYIDLRAIQKTNKTQSEILTSKSGFD